MLEHPGGEKLCKHPRVTVNEGVLTVLDLEQGFSDADFRLKLLLLLLAELEEEEMSSSNLFGIKNISKFLNISTKSIEIEN
jgi:hypothetical protein